MADAEEEVHAQMESTGIRSHVDYVVIAREETHAGVPESNLSAAEGIGSLELFSE
jgi:hypothetical protein